MPEQTKLKVTPNMTLYKQKGFLLYNVTKVNYTKGIVELQKMFSDTPEPPITIDQLLLDISQKKFKVLSVAETKEFIKQAAEKIKKARNRLSLASKAIDKREEQYTQFKRRAAEYERTLIRS